ncbi:MAG: AAA family ATPase [Nocardioides sp.]|nr:AAA family ATPase [Nocardioides sp.]
MPSFLALPDPLAAKSDPLLVGADEQHFALIDTALQAAVADLEERLAEVRAGSGGDYQEVLERDQQVHHLTGRLRALRRYGVDLCLGRMDPVDGPPVYVGRLGLSGPGGDRLLVDWRTPAAEPWFAATHGDPRGLVSRRRYRWSAGRVVDYWDEVFDPDAVAAHAAALDDRSSFVASLGEARTGRMRDVLGTLQADQDAIVRAGSRGALVVDGGPGTGKTVVALHRTAYLLHADPRVGRDRGGVLVLGPSRPYLHHVADVLPSLGEHGVATATLRDLLGPVAADVPDDLPDEADPHVAVLKADAAMVEAVDRAVAVYEEPPTTGIEVATPWGPLWLGSAGWEEAFEAPGPGAVHDEARDEVWQAVVAVLHDQLDHDALDSDGVTVTTDDLAAVLRRDAVLVDLFDRGWPVLDASEVVEDLWTVAALLRHCAPHLVEDDVRRLLRSDPRAWTTSDLPLLDAARRRVGDRGVVRERHRREAEARAERTRMDEVVDHAIATDDSDLAIMSMLRGADLREALAGDLVGAAAPVRELAGPFAHVVVDEAQELTDAEWRMVLDRCPSRSLTVVGDRAQARHGFAGTWAERLAAVGLDRVEVASLTVNYRTPVEVMEAAEPVVRAVLPDANVPTSVRSTGVPVAHLPVTALQQVLDEWLAEHPGTGTACVLTTQPPPAAAVPDSPQVSVLHPAASKGLEYDLVVLLDPDSFGEGVTGAVDRYVAMTRATQRLVLLEPGPAERPEER